MKKNSTKKISEILQQKMTFSQSKKNIKILYLVILMMGGHTSLVYAGNNEDTSSVSLPRKAAKKFTRGFVNILTAPGELIKQPLIEADKADSLMGVPAGCMTGFFMGVGWMFYRIGTGFFDVVTFPLPINNYESLINPEFII